MPHQDTNNNEMYDFVDSEGAEDGPYTEDGDTVLDDAALTVKDDEMDGADGGMQDDNGMDGDGIDGDMSDGDGAGFGAVVALLAIIGAVFAARRLN